VGHGGVGDLHAALALVNTRRPQAIAIDLRKPAAHVAVHATTVKDAIRIMIAAPPE